MNPRPKTFRWSFYVRSLRFRTFARLAPKGRIKALLSCKDSPPFARKEVWLSCLNDVLPDRQENRVRR